MLVRTLAALRANGVPLIYAFSDGPRNASDTADVTEVRRVLRGVDWAEIHVVERPENVGLNASLIRGISEVLHIHDDVVVCEEDIEFSQGVYSYLLAALERYRDEPRVMSVGGWTHPRMTPSDARDVPHFTGRFTEWGWATWRRAWAGFPNVSPIELRDRCVARGIDFGKYGRDVADWVASNPEDLSWDYAFNLHMMLHDGLALLPPRAMTEHIGYDEKSTHPQDRSEWNDHAEPPPPLDQVQWPEVRENSGSAECWRRAMERPAPPSLMERIRRRLARLIKRTVLRRPRA